MFLRRAGGTDSPGLGAGAGAKASAGGGREAGEGAAGGRGGQSRAGQAGGGPAEDPGAAGEGLRSRRPYSCASGCFKARCLVSRQAAELAEYTAKISLLEEAKKKKEEEATEWQHKVRNVRCFHVISP